VTLFQFLDITERIVKLAAILTGGVWTYYRFIRGRTYRPRLETSLTAEAVRRGGQTYLIACLNIRNLGTAKVEIKQEGSGLRLFSCDLCMSTSAPGEPSLTRIATLPVFMHHKWVESSETIRHEVLYVLTANHAAVKLEFRLCAKGIEWNSETYVTLPEAAEPGTLKTT
jgi:hypothetical protein